MTSKPRIALCLALLSLGLASWAQSTGTSDLVQKKGSRLDVFGGYGLAPSYGSSEDYLLAAGWRVGLGIEALSGNFIPLRVEASYFSIGASAWDSSLFRYRAFYGLRLAALSGLRLGLGGGSELDLLAGLGASPSGYTDLSVATAYLSAMVEPRYILPFTLKGLSKAKIVLSTPVEYMFRGTARTVDGEVNLSLQWDTSPSKGGSR